ncbi:MAG: globin family protein [Planctomycetota bacterium]
MTPEQVEMVQSSWAKVVPIKDVAADLFYGKLFELDPSLRELFPDEMSEQKQKLMTMINTAVGGLTNLDAIVSAVQDLGRRHVGYRVTTPMYDTVGAALLDTLEKGLGDAWTDELKEAWTLVYTTLATVMIAAAEEETATA